MKKRFFAFVCGAAVLLYSFTSWSGTTLKPVLKQSPQALVPAKTDSRDLPDLYIESVKSSPMVIQGRRIPVFAVTVKNGGKVLCKGNNGDRKSTVKGYTLDVSLSGKRLISIQKTPDILPGESREFVLSGKIAISSSLTPGDYNSLQVTVDPQNSIREIREDNNIKMVKLTVRSAQMPDLTVSASGSSEAKIGTYIPAFSITVENRGNAPAPGAAPNQTGDQVEGYFISIRLIPAGSQQSGQGIRVVTQTSDLPPGQSMTRAMNNSLMIPADTVPGEYQIQLVVDSDRRVQESSETNNVFVHNIRITDDPPPELSVAFPSMSPVAEPGKKISSCTVSVSNTGGKTAPGGAIGFSIVLLLSENASAPQVIPDQVGNSYSGGIVLYKIWYPDSLAPGQTRSYPLDNVLTVQGNTQPGQYYVIAAVDPAGRVAEQNENNNTAAAPIRVQLPNRPDLEVIRVMPLEGHSVEITFRNNGPGTIPDSVYAGTGPGFQVYRDNTPASGMSLSLMDPGKVLKNPGGTVTVTVGVPINCAESPGNHVIRVKIDPVNQIDEASELNNERSTNRNCP